MSAKPLPLDFQAESEPIPRQLSEPVRLRRAMPALGDTIVDLVATAAAGKPVHATVVDVLDGGGRFTINNPDLTGPKFHYDFQINLTWSSIL